MPWFSILIANNQAGTLVQSKVALADHLGKLQRESDDPSAFRWYEMDMGEAQKMYYLSPMAGEALSKDQKSWPGATKRFAIQPCAQPNMGAVRELPL